MADRVFVLAGSLDDFAQGSIISEEMISDLLEIARLDSVSLDQVVAALERSEGFLDDSRIERLVQESMDDEKLVAAVVKALLNLRPGTVAQTLTALARWREADARRAERLPDSLLKAIKSILPKLICEVPALERQRKARRLASFTGHQAREMNIVCDARPIFDKDRNTIEGFLTRMTLKVRYETQTGDAGCIELELSPALLKDLIEKSTKAQVKIARLHTSIQSWIPDGLAESTD